MDRERYARWSIQPVPTFGLVRAMGRPDHRLRPNRHDLVETVRSPIYGVGSRVCGTVCSGSAFRDRARVSRGRWEGNTLIVETTNFNNIGDRSINRMLGVITFGTSATARVIERFTRLDADTIDYQVTDPSTYTQPWTAAVPMTKLQGTVFEFACHEGNYGMAGILTGHRAEEKAAEAANGK